MLTSGKVHLSGLMIVMTLLALKHFCYKVNELVMKKKGFFACVKTKTQISFAVTLKLISAFVFTTQIVQFLFYLFLKFQAPNLLL